MPASQSAAAAQGPQMQAPMDEFLRHFRPAEVLFNLGKLADAHRGLRIAFEIAERCSILSDVDLQDLAAKVKQCEEDGADANRATCKDSLGLLPAAKGVAMFLLHPETATTSMAVYGPWGQGKSTFMQLVEQEILLQAAFYQVETMERIDEGVLHTQFTEIVQRLEAYKANDKDLAMIEALASPRLLTVWFNAWEYINEDQVWGGLMVEVTRRLEEKLSPKHRAVMRCWWRGLLWLPLLLWPQRTWLAVKYNWQKRRSELFLQCMLPVMAVLAVVTSLTVFGVTATLAAGNKDSSVIQAAAAAVALTGIVVAVLGVVERSLKVVKQISDIIKDGLSMISLQKHSERVGYQHAVRKDLAVLKTLLQGSFKPFRNHRPRITAAKAAAHQAAVEQARRSQAYARAAEVAAQNAALAYAAAKCAGTDKECQDAAAAVVRAKNAANAAHAAALAAANAADKSRQAADNIRKTNMADSRRETVRKEFEAAAKAAKAAAEVASSAVARCASPQPIVSYLGGCVGWIGADRKPQPTDIEAQSHAEEQQAQPREQQAQLENPPVPEQQAQPEEQQAPEQHMLSASALVQEQGPQQSPFWHQSHHDTDAIASGGSLALEPADAGVTFSAGSSLAPAAKDLLGAVSPQHGCSQAQAWLRQPKTSWVQCVRSMAARVLPCCSHDETYTKHSHVKAPLLPSATDQFNVVVFIDDLDRCKPSKVVEVLEAINIVLAGSDYSVMIGVDRDFICNAIKHVYKDTGINTDEQADIFLQKVVQVDLVLPKPTSLEIKQYLHGMGADTFKPGLLSNPSSGRASRSSTRSPVGVGPTDATHVDQDATSSAAAGAAAGIAQRRDLQRLTGSKGYSIDETKAILTIINKNVLAGMSPRAMKRLLNHYRLAKYIYLQQTEGLKSDPDAEKPYVVYRKLLGWVTIWWRYPQGMNALMQYAGQDVPPWNSLSQLLLNLLSQHEQQQQQQRNAADGGASQELEADARRQEAFEQSKQQLLAIRKLILPDDPSDPESIRCRRLFDLERSRVNLFRMFGNGFIVYQKDEQSDTSWLHAQPSVTATEVTAAVEAAAAAIAFAPAGHGAAGFTNVQRQWLEDEQLEYPLTEASFEVADADAAAEAQPLATFANQEIVDLGAALPASAEPLPINRRTLGPWQNEGSNQAAWDYAHDVIAAEAAGALAPAGDAVTAALGPFPEIEAADYDI